MQYMSSLEAAGPDPAALAALACEHSDVTILFLDIVGECRATRTLGTYLVPTETTTRQN
jgi:hypothetical protein